MKESCLPYLPVHYRIRFHLCAYLQSSCMQLLSFHSFLEIVSWNLQHNLSLCHHHHHFMHHSTYFFPRITSPISTLLLTTEHDDHHRIDYFLYVVVCCMWLSESKEFFFWFPLFFSLVRLHRRNSKAHGGIRLLHNERNRL